MFWVARATAHQHVDLAVGVSQMLKPLFFHYFQRLGESSCSTARTPKPRKIVHSGQSWFPSRPPHYVQGRLAANVKPRSAPRILNWRRQRPQMRPGAWRQWGRRNHSLRVINKTLRKGRLSLRPRSRRSLRLKNEQRGPSRQNSFPDSHPSQWTLFSRVYQPPAQWSRLKKKRLNMKGIWKIRSAQTCPPRGKAKCRSNELS